ncbi:hypothetical protein LEP1GSC034_1043 [Leptospira interrogans str. 2003000735]|uniref:Uncharacterized protein n=2 Tax=Leptospira interrogans TaxID=173 RepID=A0A829DBK7_LEPIR|nr:hypothetical protein [Leptospira interrogans]EMY06278.1 hypothetical protein LEP1GSC029_3180 [Leptospira interrogans str. 2002000626]EMY25689.1 hypothetical protein LEP1GSC115_1451 [Leptospira interrogans serovar Australis str. 200703203]EKN89919.1 hypothetical protein LEP1GSC027_3995 [Leptospira interrogans str. 2002000624]EKQ40328.1 hypothetical protein LEP1GSC025_2190 [Leptospira interrogans str. 2002000621]EKQ46134.1 hypothetical protein LEP1GSC026_3188 [Leptospira interrogans str. 2002
MNYKERREYIAEKILKAKKRIKYITWFHAPGKDFQPPFDWEFPDGKIIDSKTDFEFLNEWVGPICEVVLPMLTKRNWSILPIGSKVTIIELIQFESKEIQAYDFINVIMFEPLVTALVDSHIKIEKEKKLNE